MLKRKVTIDKILIFAFVFSIVLFSYRESYTLFAKILGGLLGLLFLARVYFGKRQVIIPGEFMWFGVWLLFSMLSGLVMATNPDTFLNMFLVVLQVGSVSFVLFNLLTWMQQPMFLLFSIFWSTIVMSIIVSLNPIAYTFGGRLEGTLGNANMYGLALLISIIYGLNQVFRGRHIFKLFYFASLPPLLFLLGETGSRKAIISVILFIAIYGFLKSKISIRKKPVVALLTVVVLSAVAFSSYYYLKTTKHYHRFEEFTSSMVSGKPKRADESTRNRLLLYQVGIKTTMENPVMGVGLDNFRHQTMVNRAGPIGTYAHSNYMELLADTGFVGFALYCAMYVLLLIRLIKLRPAKVGDNQIALYVLATSLLIIFILYDFAMVSYFEKFSWLILTFLVAATQGISESKTNKILKTADSATLLTPAVNSGHQPIHAAFLS